MSGLPERPRAPLATVVWNKRS